MTTVKTALLLCGGNGSRLRPALAKSINKHLATVHNKPMVHYPLSTLAQMGVENVFITLTGHHNDPLLAEIGMGENWNINVCFVYPQRIAIYGPAASMMVAERWIKGSFVLMLGDSIYLQTPPMPDLVDPNLAYCWAMPFDLDWDDISKYAQVGFDKKTGKVNFLKRTNEILSEKPFIQTGAWIFPQSIFALIKEMLKQKEGELRISDLTAELVKKSRLVALPIPRKSFIDAGTWPAIRKVEEVLKP